VPAKAGRDVSARLSVSVRPERTTLEPAPSRASRQKIPPAGKPSFAFQNMTGVRALQPHSQAAAGNVHVKRHQLIRQK
jgi:hypothetical protein